MILSVVMLSSSGLSRVIRESSIVHVLHLISVVDSFFFSLVDFRA